MSNNKKKEATPENVAEQIGEVIGIKELYSRIENGTGFFKFCDGGLSVSALDANGNTVQYKSPKLDDDQMFTLTGISKTAMYLAYADAFTMDENLKVFQFSTTNGGQVIACEEHHKGQYAILREQNGILDIAVPEDPSKGLPIITAILLGKWAFQKENGFAYLESMSRNSGTVTIRTNGSVETFSGTYDTIWQKNPDAWKIMDNTIQLQIKKLGNELTAFVEAEEKNGTKFRIRKIFKPEEKTLPPQCEKAKFFRKTKTPDEFETACEELAELFGQKKRGTLKDALLAIPKLMTPEEMFEDQKLLVHTWEEDLFLNGFVLEKWNWEALFGAAKGIYRNFFLYGPAGSGKSTLKQFLSFALGLPDWGDIICSSNMDRNNFIAEHVIDEDGKISIKCSVLIKCLRYGGIVEIQEPTCIRDPGVMTCTNNYIAPTGWIEIAETGERFPRHPKSIVIFSSNLNYAGCKDPNTSVLSRHDFVKFIPRLDEETLVSRVETEPEVNLEKDYLLKMAKVFNSLAQTAEEDGVAPPGDTSYRTFRAWCKRTSLDGDPFEAAESTLIDKMAFTSDEEPKMKLRQILHSLLQTKPKKVKIDEEFEDLLAFVVKK